MNDYSGSNGTGNSTWPGGFTQPTIGPHIVPSTGTGSLPYPTTPQPQPQQPQPQTLPLDGSTWVLPDGYELPGDEELAKKMLHDPEFDVGEVILEMVKDWIKKKRGELEDHPVAKKYLPKAECCFG